MKTQKVAPRILTAGALTARYDEEAGDLRDIRFAGRLVCLRLYGAVRDEHWGTVAGEMDETTIEEGEGFFRVRFALSHKSGAIDFRWRGTIEGHAAGVLSFSFEGEAHSNFRRNRIGLCILHPMETSGQSATVTRTGGERVATHLPEQITPDQPPLPFTEMSALEHELPGGGDVHFTFEGEDFEMEDQRNWTDASFKTFCTPLGRPYPVEVKTGERIFQRVTLRVSGAAAGAVARAAGPVSLTLTGEPAVALPEIGFGLGPWPDTNDEALIERIRALRPAHLRADLRPGERGWLDTLSAVAHLSRRADCAVELALYLDPEKDGAAIETLRFELEEKLSCDIARWLLYFPSEHPLQRPDYPALLAACERLPAAPRFVGTDSDFLLLNRYPPSAGDGVTFAMNPQVHAFDDESLIETCAAQKIVAQNAVRLAQGRPVALSPLTLLPRWNPYSPGKAPRGEPPADPRQSQPFAAAWTLASLKNLFEGGLDSVTLYETHGPRGILDTPIEALRKALVDAKAALPCHSSDPLRAEALVFEDSQGRQHALLANLTDAPLEVIPPGGPPVTLAPFEVTAPPRA